MNNGAGKGRSLFATNLLPRKVDSEVTVDVKGSVDGMREIWEKAPSEEVGKTQSWPHAFKVKLVSLFP